nr:9679_t:CDS:2 [Entrophospora candida]
MYIGDSDDDDNDDSDDNVDNVDNSDIDPVSNVHRTAELSELKEFFSSHGNIYRIRLDTKDYDGVERPNGYVFITYRQPVRFHGRPLNIEWMNNNNNINNYNIATGDTYVSEWKSSERVHFSIDYNYRVIKIIFAILTITSKYPAKLWLLDKSSRLKNKFYWCLEDSWLRKTEIRTTSKTAEEKELPLQLNMPNGSDSSGKWVVYRVTFNICQIIGGIRRFREMLTKMINFNLTSGQFSKNLIVIDNTTRLLRKITNYSMLEFDVLYLLYSVISHNYINEYNLTIEFLKLLNSLPRETAKYILESISGRKKRIYDPLAYLQEEIKKQKNIERRAKQIPQHCVLMRKVVITPTTMYFLLPTMETSNRVIRHFHDVKDNFLRVQFIDEAGGKIRPSSGTNNDALYNRVYLTLVNGINIGDRHYEFLAFSSSQLREHSCWFFAPTSDLIADDIREWMGDFKNIKNVAKYAARMGQCFSSTRPVVNLPVNDIREIPDIVRNGFTFSDGVGKISYNLSTKIAEILELKSVPSAFQFRLAGYKGVLCQSRYLRGNQIHVRPSQNKFESSHNVLEIIRGSCNITAYLNRQAITLLSTLGVADEVFVELKDNMVNELDKMLKNDNTAISVLMANIDEYGVSRIMADMVKAGFLDRKDPYLVNLISLFRITMLRDLKQKAKIRVSMGTYLLGVLDETESLKEDEVYCCISDPQNPASRKVITGTCVVFRNPCFHPGDIRVVTAVKVKALDYLVDVLVFPTLGYRDLPSQCSGGDLDGDDFTIFWDENLIPKTKNWEPMNYEAPKAAIVDEVKMVHIKKFFVNYILSDQLGSIANSHLAKADYLSGGAFHGQCIRLAQLHSEAVDFPKTGIPAEFPVELRPSKYPDFMEKPDKPVYESEKILGKLYRSIEVEPFDPYTNITFDERLYVPGFEEYLEDARFNKRSYTSDIRSLINQFGVMSEYETVSGFIVNPTIKVEQKKPREVKKSVMDAVAAIQKQYRKVFEEEFYGEGTNLPSPDARNRMEAKAFAWYYVTYHPAEIDKDGEENLMSFPWIVHSMLCDIAIRNTNRFQSKEEFFSRYNSIFRTSNYTRIDKISSTRSASENNNNASDDGNIRSDYSYRNGDEVEYFIDEFDDGMERLRRSLASSLSIS